MKFFLSLLYFCALAIAGPLESRDGAFLSDTANDMASGKCAPAAAIFARGTFDSGNIGVWVGPQLLNPLKEQGFAIQGVDAKQYPADLAGYLKEGGSSSGAKALAATVTNYAKNCPDSAIVISGWSQGALVAHKGLALLSSSVQKQVAGFVTFGDPNNLFDKTSVPSSIPFRDYCVRGSIFDPLCAKLPGDFKLPRSVDDLLGPFKKLPTLAHGAQQTKAAASLLAGFPGQFARNVGTVLKDLAKGDIMKLLLTPEHFTYGNNGMAKQAAEFILSQDGIKSALKGGKGGKSGSGGGSAGGGGGTGSKGKAAAAGGKGGAPRKSKARRSVSYFDELSRRYTPEELQMFAPQLYRRMASRDVVNPRDASVNSERAGSLRRRQADMVLS